MEVFYFLKSLYDVVQFVSVMYSNFYPSFKNTIVGGYCQSVYVYVKFVSYDHSNVFCDTFSVNALYADGCIKEHFIASHVPFHCKDAMAIGSAKTVCNLA